MYLENLTIKGFKSFAQKTVLDFPKPGTQNKNHITAIVGPNGAGKSNIADAIRWVLGEQGLKLIRCKKGSDIIFSGSEQKSRINFAEGSIRFNNHDKQANIEYSEVTITRRLYRNGDSEYYINNNKARLFDILILLAKSNIGTKSFSIIGQGMIDSIIMCTPLERCDFFNEAVGIKQYQIKRDHSLNKLERSENNMLQAQAIVHEIQPVLNSLTKQVKRLQKRKELEKEIKILQTEYYSRLYSNIHEQLKKHDTELRIIEEQEEEKTQELEEIKKELRILESQSTRSEIFEKLQYEQSSLITKRNYLTRDISVLKGKKDIKLAEQGQLNLAWLYRKEEETQEKVEEKTKQLENINQEKQLILKQLTETENKIKAVDEEIEKTTKNISRIKEEISEKINKLPLSRLKIEMMNLCASQEKFIKKLKNANSLDDLKTLGEEAETIHQKLCSMKQKTQEASEEMTSQKDINENESEEIVFQQGKLEKLLEEKESIFIKINDYKIQTKIFQEKETILNEEILRYGHDKKKIALDIATTEGKDPEKLNKNIEKEIKETEENIKNISDQIECLNKKMSSFNQDEEKKKDKMFELDRTRQKIQNEWNHLNAQINQIKINTAKLETRREDLEIEIARETNNLHGIVQTKPFKNQELKETQDEQIFIQINKIKSQLEIIGGIDPEIVKEYETTKERYDFLTTQITDMESAIKSLEKIITELDDRIKTQFDEAFRRINSEFERYFKILFSGGKAKLTKILEEPEKENPTEEDIVAGVLAGQDQLPTQAKQEKEKQQTITAKYKKKTYRGIDIYACPPWKKLLNIEMLSGGERSMTSIALIAAIISINPSPLVLFDEVDAALDEINSTKLGAILKDLAQKTQFIVITHNRSLMYIADFIYGVTMNKDGVSNLLSVKLEEEQPA